MSDEALVSVIIPAYNLERYIERSLKSVLDQTYENIEIILVDDGSTDRTVEVAEKVLKNSGKPFKIISQKNQGVSVARNTGLANARGKYIKFLDGDDTLFPYAIEELVDALETNDCQMAFGGQDVVNIEGKQLYAYNETYTYNEGIYSGKEVLKDFITSVTYAHLNTSIFRKNIIENYTLRFTQGARYSEDNEFIAKYLYYSKRVYVFDKAFAELLYRTSSTTKRPTLAAFHNVGSLLRLKKFFEENGESEIVEILLTKSIPIAYSWTLGNLAFNGYPLKDWMKLARNELIRQQIVNALLEVNKTKMGKQLAFLKNIYKISPFLCYSLLRLAGWIFKLNSRH
ncbi:glycosyltransferase [Fervidobacterium islandicum]|uniref:Glycosyltransferase n=1 Tax=Fervidobacterium islandicum TaxID=2423 RepID=A0AAI8CL59_FERIS|nr:glycosyltransferase family 2 protein [Fervidobacterium islandicum]AMW33407.1 glycosyltransferase [Fervidobacterium islandicum]